jgi:hypothetical protein
MADQNPQQTEPKAPGPASAHPCNDPNLSPEEFLQAVMHDDTFSMPLQEEPLTLPPDIHEYQTRTPPAKIGDETHQPGGELHAVAPKEEEPPSELPEPPLETECEELGDLPEELRDLPDPVPEPKGSVYPQPVSISLNKE